MRAGEYYLRRGNTETIPLQKARLSKDATPWQAQSPRAELTKAIRRYFIIDYR